MGSFGLSRFQSFSSYMYIVQQIKVKLVAIDIEFNSTSTYPGPSFIFREHSPQFPFSIFKNLIEYLSSNNIA